MIKYDLPATIDYIVKKNRTEANLLWGPFPGNSYQIAKKYLNLIVL